MTSKGKMVIMPVQDALDYAQKILEQTFKHLITTHKTYNS